MKTEVEPNYYVVDCFEDMRSYYEELFATKNCPILYKVRNWREMYHPEFLTKGEIYFSRPNELNDPFDIHRPKKFDVSVIDSKEFYHKLVEDAPHFLRTAPGRDSEVAASNYLEYEIRPNPEEFFLRNYVIMINDKQYNETIGVLSLTTNPLDEQLWGYYGGGLKGFAVGFDSMRLTEELFCQARFVKYNDEISTSTIISKSKKSLTDGWYEKNKKWHFESEFRFAKLIHEKSPRIHHFTPEIVSEIILGPRIPEDDENAIKNIWKCRYPNSKLFKIQCNYSNGTLSLNQVG
jgi:hypothetical protein